MRILHISVRYNADINSGIGKKIFSQINAMRKVGFDVIPFYIHDSTESTVNNSENINYINVSSNLKVGNKVYRRKRTAKEIERIFLEKNWDYAFIRYYFADPFLLKLVKKFPNKIIFEHQGKELGDGVGGANRFPSFKYFSERFLAPFVLYYALGSVGVTEPTSLHEKKRAFRNSLRVKTISNGIEVDKIEKREIPEFDGKSINLLFVGNMKVYHGIDRLLQGIYHYDGSYDLHLYLVGAGNAVKSLKELTSSLNIEERVTFTGPIYDEDSLNQMFNKCHLAVGSLGLHRYGLKVASNLKIREYIARNMPWIMSNIDEDLRDGKLKDFYLKIPSSDQAVNVNKVVSFTQDLYQEEIDWERLRKFAQKNLDMEVKMRELKRFIKKIEMETP